MKACPRIRAGAAALGAGVLFSAVSAGGPATASTPAVRDEKPVEMDKVVVSETKTHTLFMGADISVNLDQDLYAVRDVVGSSWVIDINGKDRIISSRPELNLKITPGLKLTEVSATIVGFSRTKAYSYENDPSVRLTKGLSKSATINSDMLAVAQNAQHVADVENSHMGGASYLAGSDDQFSANALMTMAAYNYSNTHPTILGKNGLPLPSPYAPSTNPSTIGNPIEPNTILPPNSALFTNPSQVLNAGITQHSADTASAQTQNGNEPAGRLTTQGLDAMDVDFEISSARPLRTPYVVTMTRFHPAGAKPGIVQSLVYAKSLDPIDSHLSHVHFVEDGFPFDYELVDFQLHIYERGQEIATNISNDRVELTREEAFEYIKMEYIAAHKGETSPPLPALGKLPAELPNRLAAGKYHETFFVKVSKDGLAEEPFADLSCSKKIDDPFLEAVVRSLRFKPALAQGNAVDGVAAVNLTKLSI